MLEAAHDRLSGVTIERLPWAAFIKRYDRTGTLFYLDPPYFGCENDYGKDMFERAEFDQMADMLRNLKGKFVLSLNDHEEVRRIFSGFRIDEAEVKYSISSTQKGKTFGEVIITNT